MYFAMPEYEKAVEDCTEALRINPKHERSVGRRGTALEKLGRYEEAVRGKSFSSCVDSLLRNLLQ